MLTGAQSLLPFLPCRGPAVYLLWSINMLLNERVEYDRLRCVVKLF